MPHNNYSTYSNNVFVSSKGYTFYRKIKVVLIDNNNYKANETEMLSRCDGKKYCKFENV